MRINSFLVPALFLVSLLGTVSVAQVMGRWSTSGRDAVDIANMTPADLKGWMTLQDVMDGLKISKEELYTIGSIPAATSPSTALKDLESVVSVAGMRDKLTARLGGLNLVSNPVPTLRAATPVPTLAPTAAATKNQLNSATSVPAGKGAGNATPVLLPAGQALAADQIRGRMTLREVSEQCMIPIETLLAELKMTGLNPDTAIKDLIQQGKLVDVTDVQQIVASFQAK